MRRKIKRFYPLFIAFLLLAAGFVLVRSGWFKINKIDCRLDQYPCPLIYEPVLVSLHNQNILKLSTVNLTQQFQSIDAGIDTVVLRRTLPDKIQLKLTRRQALARIELSDGTVFFLDNKGEIFPALTEINNQLPVINVPGDQPISFGQSDFGSSLFELITALNEYFISAQKISWLPPSIIEMQTTKGPEVVINLEKDISSEIAALQYILSGFKIDEALPAKIDLRFDKPILSY